jgi:hypothetical protein
MRSFVSRVKVVGIGFGLGTMLSAMGASSGAAKMGWSPVDTAGVWASVLAGPFAGLWATATWGWADAIGWAAACGVAMAAHPVRPGWVTGAISAVGVGAWVLLGFALTYDGV